jgi:di/tricarboxylate transporter
MQAIALNPHAISVLLLTLVALFLFSRDRLPIETSALLIIVSLGLGFTIFPYGEGEQQVEPSDFFMGFGNEALVAISALMMASESLVRTGALTPIGRLIARYWNNSPQLAFIVLLMMTAVLSAFMNNTPQVVLMIPILVSVSLRSGMAASSTLMPMTFAAQIGGMATPIGTSLNLLVIGSATALGVRNFGMFDFFAPAAIAGSVGILFLWLVAPRILPHRTPQMPDISPRVFTTRFNVGADSKITGKTISEAIEKSGGRVKILRLERKGVAVLPLPDTTLEEGDSFTIRDTPERIKEIEQTWGVLLHTSGDGAQNVEKPVGAEDQQLAELVITPHSPLVGRSLHDSDFDERYQLIPLALHRVEKGMDMQLQNIESTPLRLGDVLLIQGPVERIAALRQTGDLMVLDASTLLPLTQKALMALSIMGLIVLASSLKILPVAQSAVAGVLLMIGTRCLDWRTAFRALDSKMIFLTVASIALSMAMVKTGAAQFLAQEFAQATSHLPGTWILSALILFMALMANLVSNSAAAVIGTPIAIKLAHELGYSPEAFVLAVLFGVNMSYATPMADNCNLMVYGAGNYKFTDFLRVGIPLTLLMWAAYSLLLPIFFPI